jgi:hypothetical protein
MRYAFIVLALALTGCLALTSHDGLWPCSGDSDCSGGDTCRSIDYGPNQCVPAGYCEVPADCPLSQSSVLWQCTNNQCTLPPCNTDTDCGSYACTDGTCATTCTDTSQCGPGYACSDGPCLQPPCNSDSQCGAYTCVSGVCGASCEDDTDCSPGNLCNGGACTPRSCTVGSPGQCDGFACDAGICASQCNDASQCDPGLSCVNGACQCGPTSCGAYACMNAYACFTSCASDSDCASTTSCIDGACVACVGTALDCESQGGCNVPGCSTGMVCNGGPIACSEFNNASDTCSGIVGCSYDFSTIQCVGSATCAGQFWAACPSEFGCSVGTACTGTPTPCDQLPLSQCTATSGCTLM